MKKKICLAVIAVAVVGIIVGAVLLWKGLTPEADPIRLPAAENITEVLIENSKEAILMGTEDGEYMLQYLREAEPTHEMSVNERPDAERYYTILIMEGETEHRYFLYEKDGTVYVERSYEGIYTVTRLALELARVYDNE
jgi:hypothetical protein